MSVFIAFRVVIGCFFLITVSIYYDSFHVVTFNYFTSITKSSFIINPADVASLSIGG